MIAAVKGWYAAWAALLVFCPPRAGAAGDPQSAARELAARTVDFAGGGAALAVVWHNASSLGSSESARARAAFEAALQQAGERIGETATIEVRLTLTENPTEYLLVEEARRGEERQVWMAAWARPEEGSRRISPGVSLDLKLVWEQDEQILDVAFPAGAMLVLAPSNVTLYARVSGQWAARQRLPLTPAKPWPRDLRGRLRASGTNFQVYLPGMRCTGATDPTPAMECGASEEPWVLESGSRGLLLANFMAGRNYFDGRVVAQNGAQRAVVPFYSAARVEDRGETFWLLAPVDGRTQFFDGGLNPVSGGATPAWGSDIAGIDAGCGPASQVLATRPGDSSEPDAIQAFSLVERTVAPVTSAAIFPGPVTALWTSGGASALAVARDLSTGRYAAYVITVACGA
jgi:hypothetical protein